MENYSLEQIKELIHKDFEFELVTFKTQTLGSCLQT